MKFPEVKTIGFGLSQQCDRTLAIAILQKARDRVESGVESWVCLAINDVSNPACRQVCDHNQTPVTNIIGIKLKEEIERRLGTRAFITTWLCDQVGDDALEGFNFCEYRLTWIDSMIEELK